MTLVIGKLAIDGSVAKWDSPGPLVSFKTVGAFARWSARKFCPEYDGHYDLFMYAVVRGLQRGAYVDVLPDRRFNDLLEHGNLLISCVRVVNNGIHEDCFVVKN